MAWNKIVTSDVVIQRCIEQPGLYQQMNRSYDALVAPGATSVRRPLLSSLTVRKNTGEEYEDRKKAKADTTMIETSLDVYAVGIFNEMAAQFESNDALLREYEISMAMQLGQQFDLDVIAAADATKNVIETAATGTLVWKDIVKCMANLDKKQVPRDNRVIVIPAELEDQFWDMDIVKSAAAYNSTILTSGRFVEFMGMKFFITGLAPKVAEKDAVRMIYGPGLAFILSHTGQIESVYDPVNVGKVYDMLAHGAAALDDDKFAVVMKLK